MNVLNNRLVTLCSGFAIRGLLVAGLLLSVSAVSAQTDSFDTCVKGLRQSVVSQGIQAAVFDRAMKGVEPDPDVLKAFSFQPEFRTAIWDYLAGLVDQERVEDGRAKLKEWSRS